MKLKKFAFLILVRKIITRETDEVTNSCTVHKVYIPFISFMYPFIPFILFIYSPLFQEFQNCQANIDTHSLIFETETDRDLSPSLSKAWGERKPVVPVPDDQHHHHEVLQICSN